VDICGRYARGVLNDIDDDWGITGRRRIEGGPCEVCDIYARFYIIRDEQPRWLCYDHFMIVNIDNEWFELTILALKAHGNVTSVGIQGKLCEPILADGRVLVSGSL